MNAKKQVKVDMNQARLMQVLQKPYMSEKATIIAEKNGHFVFQVAPCATKTEIKKAIELLFEVQVESVRVCNVKSKERRFKQTIGKRNGWKKAYIALKEGQDINFVGTK